jgi:hypothetical protein
VLRVTVDNQPDAQGRWPVTSIGTAGPPAGSRGQARARGVISTFTSIADFRVGGTPVDASTAQIVGGTLGAQVRVEIEGRLLGGVLIATRVEVEDAAADEIEVRGRIVSVDAVARVLEFNGNRERVSYARTDVVYENGTVADLAAGRRVRAYGVLSADGTVVEARRIRFDD